MVTLTLFETSLEPRSLVVDPPMTDAELEMLCLRSDTVQIERTSEGVIRMNAEGGLDEQRQFEISFQLGNWWAAPPSRSRFGFQRRVFPGGWIVVESGCGLCFAGAIEGIDEGRFGADAAALSGVCGGVAFAVGQPGRDAKEDDVLGC
jgi:hypothetical protein